MVYLELVICSAKHSHSKLPTVDVAAAAWSVAIGDDDAGGCGHMTVMTWVTTAMIDDEDRLMWTYKHRTVARCTARTALKRRLYLQPVHTRCLKTVSIHSSRNFRLNGGPDPTFWSGERTPHHFLSQKFCLRNDAHNIDYKPSTIVTKI